MIRGAKIRPISANLKEQGRSNVHEIWRNIRRIFVRKWLEARVKKRISSNHIQFFFAGALV
jgi:hypothetical protein